MTNEGLIENVILSENEAVFQSMYIARYILFKQEPNKVTKGDVNPTMQNYTFR